MLARSVFIFLTASVSLLTPAKEGVGVFVFFPERQQERRQSRWTLGEWLSTKKTIADQNLWLAKHTHKVPMDLSYSVDVRAPGRVGHEVDFFLAWLGLRARYESPWSLLEERLTSTVFNPRHLEGEAAIALRLAGGNPQNTSLVVRGVFEYRHLVSLAQSLNGAYKGWTIEPELQIYWAPWLGIRGTYRKRFGLDATSVAGQEIAGNSWTAFAFLESNSLRAEFGYESDDWIFKDGGAAILDSFEDTAWITRLRFFF